jgi:hypothetical protein
MKPSPRGKPVVILLFSFASHSTSCRYIKEDLLAGFFAHDFLACFVVVVHPTTIFCSSIIRSANA